MNKVKEYFNYFRNPKIPKDTRIIFKSWYARYWMSNSFCTWKWSNDEIVKLFAYFGIKAPFSVERWKNPLSYDHRYLITSADGKKYISLINIAFDEDDIIMFYTEEEALKREDAFGWYHLNLEESKKVGEEKIKMS